MAEETGSWVLVCRVCDIKKAVYVDPTKINIKCSECGRVMDGIQKKTSKFQEVPEAPGPDRLIDDLNTRFSYPDLDFDKTKLRKNIRDNAKYLALYIATNAPPSRERSLAITRLEEAVFWANAAIARRS